MILKLINETDVDQPFFVLQADINTEGELLQHAIAKGDETLVHNLYFNRLFLASWLRNYDEALQMAELYSYSQVTHFIDFYHVFYHGLTAFCLAKKTCVDKMNLIGVGEKAVEKYQVWRSHNTWNFENKHMLLLAELHCVKGDYTAAEELYKASIESAQKHKFIHEEGLAMELLGLLYQKMDNSKGSKGMAEIARACYEKWGAAAVVAQFDLNYR
jgi:tetratricopeptide (TPR) repeat protein